MQHTRIVAFVLATLLPNLAFAEEATVTRAREQFVRGGAFVREAQWAEALVAFEQSARLKPHPVTTYNIGACHRAMGQYTRARDSFATSLAENQASGGTDLSPTLAAEIKTYLAELDKLVASVDFTVTPATAQVAVDGRPLEETSSRSTLRVQLDPGAHVFVFSRPGFADAVRNETFAPGATITLTIDLGRLPATLHVDSNREGALVTINDTDVGMAPVEVPRPAGRYHVAVKKKGFLSYEVDAVAQPGQRVELTAPLKEDRPALTQKWWFWTVAGVVVAGAAVTTYALTRPAAERPLPNGGGLGWTVKAP
jgi:hypothetical protein